MTTHCLFQAMVGGWVVHMNVSLFHFNLINRTLSCAKRRTRYYIYMLPDSNFLMKGDSNFLM
jgi:hypothetical protein